MSNIEKNIIQKVKEELQVSEKENLSSTELYDLLHKYRSTQHPDKYADDALKKIAEEKFKHLNELLLELSKHIEQEKQQQLPSEIVLHQKDYEIVKIKQQTVDYEKEVQSLKMTISREEDIIKNLQEEISQLQKEKINTETQDLIKLYKPSKKSIFSLGITFFLTIIIGVLSKVDEIAELIGKYFPFNIEVLNIIILIILIIIPLYYLKKRLDEDIIEKTAKIIITPIFISKFMKDLETKSGMGDRETDSFKELDVCQYITQQLSYGFKYSYSKLFIYNAISINALKDIFIYNLLNKKLISISTADKLDRKFTISKPYSRYGF
jgi:hypothetical protein